MSGIGGSVIDITRVGFWFRAPTWSYYYGTQPVTRIHFEQAWDEVLRDLRRKQSKRSIINKGPTTVQACLLSGLFKCLRSQRTKPARAGAVLDRQNEEKNKETNKEIKKDR